MRIKELCDRKVSFVAIRDVESATKMLRVVGSHSILAETVEARFLRDLIAAIATRGIDDISLAVLD